jgi:pimeloyl-ACP methyl ester carboxylesterase
MPYTTWQDHNQTVEIYYEVVGQGEPVVFHHGNGNSLRDWYTLGYVDSLKDHIQMIMIDARGYGKSSKFHDPAFYSLKSRATDTIKVLDALGIQKAHILGGSYSASLNFLLAKYYPARCRSFIFATPYFTLLDHSEIKAAMLQGGAAYLAKLEEMFGRFGNEAIRQTFLANDGKALWAANSSEWFDYHDYIKYIQVPSLIYVGEKEESVKDLQELSRQLPQCEFQILSDMGHAEAYWGGKLVAPFIQTFVLQHKIYL